MMPPDVSRYIAEIMYTGRAATSRAEIARVQADPSTPPETQDQAYEVWWGTEKRLMDAARQARSLDDLPAWVHEMAAQLGVVKPVPIVRSE